MDPTLLALGALSTGGSYLTARGNRKHAEKMWNKNNAYNTPVAQMGRLEEAGINPHLAFSKGNINNVSGGKADSPPMENPGNSALQAYQLKNIEAQNDLLRANAEKVRAEKNQIETMLPENQRNVQLQNLFNELRNIQQEYGVENADQTTKILFQRFYDESKIKNRFNENVKVGDNSATRLTEQQVRDYLTGVTVTKDVANFITRLGFGSLIGNLGKKTYKKPNGR